MEASSHTEGRSQETCPTPSGVSPFASVCWGMPSRDAEPRKGEWFPKAGTGAKLLPATAILTARQGVSGLAPGRWQSSHILGQRCRDLLVVFETMSATALIYIFDSSYIFSPNTHIIFWLLLLLIDLLSTGCQAMHQAVELIMLSPAPFLHHSALPSHVPGICSHTMAENLS